MSGIDSPYAQRIDAQTWAFIERSDSFYPPEASGWSIDQNRAAYDAMCRAFEVGYPAGVTAQTIGVEGQSGRVPVRVYRSSNNDAAAAIVYLHGGGYMLGGLESHDSICAELCAGTGFDLAAIDYRLAPEHPHPAAYEDAMSGFVWAAREFNRPVILVGDSAGGNLAAGVSHMTRESDLRPAGQVLIYPELGGDVSTGSYVEHANAPMLTARDIKALQHMRGVKAGLDDATIAPLGDPDFSDLPPTFVVTAEIDPLASDGEVYCERITAAGGKGHWIEEKGLVHGYLRARHMSDRARGSFACIVDAAHSLGHRRWDW